VVSLDLESSVGRTGQSGRPGSVLSGRINLARHFVVNKPDPEKPCFIGPGGTVSYGVFDTQMRLVASSLQYMGVKPGARIVVALDDGVELAGIFFGGLAMGAIPLAVNPCLDTGTLEHILADCEADIVFAQPGNRDAVERAAAGLRSGTRVLILEPGSFLEGSAAWIREGGDPSWDAFHEQGPDAPAFLQYTSGTTGKPKGVVHSTRSALSSCIYFAERQLGLTADDTVYSVPKTFFGYGMGNSLFFPLHLGATAVLDARWPTPAIVAENLKLFLPTVFFGVPTLYRKLLEDEGLRPETCAIRLAFSAGAPLSEQIRKAWRARFGFDLHDGIGSTELCHVFATTYPDAVRPGSLGRMVPGFRHKIVGEAGRPVATGETGVLMVQAACSAVGYWNNPEATRAKFEDGWCRTGDLFSEDADGFLYFHGREDDRFKVFGRWVAPIEIETLLKERFAEIGEAFVVPGRDAAGENLPVLFLMSGDPDFEVLAGRVCAAVAETFESHKKPALCLRLTEIPCNANGKVDRRKLCELASSALASASLHQVRRPSEADRDTAMISLEDFLAFGKEGYTLVPVWRRFDATGLTPLAVYRQLAGRGHDYLFETGRFDGGRFEKSFSYVGLPCDERIELTADRFNLVRDGARVLEEPTADPLAALQAWLRSVKVPSLEGLPDYAGGLFGYFGFEVVRMIERRLSFMPHKPAPLDLPDVLQLVSKEMVIFDHARGEVIGIVHAKPDDAASYQAAVQRLDAIGAGLSAVPTEAAGPGSSPAQTGNTAVPVPGDAGIEHSFPKPDFEAAVRRIKNYIDAGDVMQVVLSQHMTRPLAADAMDFYRAMTAINPSPYSYILNLGTCHVVGTSPELLVRCHRGTITSRPMAGTRRRSASVEENRALREELLADPKEVAEHVMLIDLARNDLGRLAETGSVRIEEKMAVEDFSHVMHIVSTVSAKLPPKVDGIDALRATFPAGTLSGASKVRAIEVINELEPESRSVYGGGIGYLTWSGDIDLAITIRTGVISDGVLHMQAGAGVVADSDPGREWQETIEKSRVLAAAAAHAEAFARMAAR
jgi:benzoate-CoA ligase family protein